jgi:hypothetical protein
MRTLDSNLLNTGTVEAAFPNPNYSIENLNDQTLKTLFQTESGQASSTITVSFDVDVSVSCLAIGNHNIDTATVTLKNSGGSTVFTKSYTTGQLSGLVADYFGATYSTVRSIEFSVTTLSAPVSIGGLYFGQYTQWPYANINPTVGQTHTGSTSKTRAGILSGSTGVKLESFNVSFDSVSISDQGLINTLFEANQANKAIYLDRYEDSVSSYPLLFVNITNLEYSGTKGTQGTYLDGVTFNFEECK